MAYLRMKAAAETFLLGVMVTHWDLRMPAPDAVEPINLGLTVVMPGDLMIDEIERATGLGR